jgi:hypothetical protein
MDLARETVSSFESNSPFKMGTAESIDYHTDNNSILNKISTFSPLWKFKYKQKEYILKKPLKISVYFEDKYWFVENETLVLISNGNTKDEAINDFYCQVIHFYNYYNKLSRDMVTGDAIRLKKEFEKLF